MLNLTPLTLSAKVSEISKLLTGVGRSLPKVTTTHRSGELQQKSKIWKGLSALLILLQLILTEAVNQNTKS